VEWQHCAAARLNEACRSHTVFPSLRGHAVRAAPPHAGDSRRACAAGRRAGVGPPARVRVPAALRRRRAAAQRHLPVCGPGPTGAHHAGGADGADRRGAAPCLPLAGRRRLTLPCTLTLCAAHSAAAAAPCRAAHVSARAAQEPAPGACPPVVTPAMRHSIILLTSHAGMRGRSGRHVCAALARLQ